MFVRKEHAFDASKIKNKSIHLCIRVSKTKISNDHLPEKRHDNLSVFRELFGSVARESAHELLDAAVAVRLEDEGEVVVLLDSEGRRLDLRDVKARSLGRKHPDFSFNCKGFNHQVFIVNPTG